MFSSLFRQTVGPIGVDLGARSVKLVQFSRDRTRLHAAGRWELPAPASDSPAEQGQRLEEVLKKAREERGFSGRNIILCLNERHLFLQNVRVPRSAGAELNRLVAQEAAGKIPFNFAETELRFVESAEVRLGDVPAREVIVFACHRPILQQVLQVVEQARLHPLAVDVEPAALVRTYASQFRREDDKQQRGLVVHVGHSRTAAIITQGEEMLFVKYIDFGGQHLDAAVARRLELEPAEAARLRKHNGDRRADLQDPEVARGISEATQPVIDRLAGELAMCVRYQSVTFRGQPLARMVLGGGEATPIMAEQLAAQLNLKTELSDPLRAYPTTLNLGRRGQWDVAVGLALRDLN